MKMKEFVI